MSQSIDPRYLIIHDEDLPSFNPNLNQGFPSFSTGPDLSSLDAFSAPYPLIMSKFISGKNDEFLSFSNTPDYNKFSAQSKPFPKMMPLYLSGKNDEFLSFSNTPDYNKFSAQSKPFPKMMSSLEAMYDSQGFLSLRFNPEKFGAFANTPTLTKIKIPNTVKFIQDYSFWNTGLKKVTIAPDCKYFEHSFPEECQIEFYEE